MHRHRAVQRGAQARGGGGRVVQVARAAEARARDVVARRAAAGVGRAARPPSTRSAAVSAASTAARAASHVPGPDERHRVVGELARAAPTAPPGPPARSAIRPGCGKTYGHDAVLPGVARSARPPPSRAQAPARYASSSRVVDGQQRVVVAGRCASTKRAPALGERGPDRARRARAARCRAMRTPTQTSPPGSWSRCRRSRRRASRGPWGASVFVERVPKAAHPGARARPQAGRVRESGPPTPARPEAGRVFF